MQHLENAVHIIIIESNTVWATSAVFFACINRGLTDFIFFSENIHGSERQGVRTTNANKNASSDFMSVLLANGNIMLSTHADAITRENMDLMVAQAFRFERRVEIKNGREVVTYSGKCVGHNDDMVMTWIILLNAWPSIYKHYHVLNSHYRFYRNANNVTERLAVTPYADFFQTGNPQHNNTTFQ